MQGQWSYAVSERMTGWPVCQLCQTQAVRARMRCRTRTATPVVPSTVVFEAELVFECVVD